MAIAFAAAASALYVSSIRPVELIAVELIAARLS